MTLIPIIPSTYNIYAVYANAHTWHIVYGKLLDNVLHTPLEHSNSDINKPHVPTWVRAVT